MFKLICFCVLTSFCRRLRGNMHILSEAFCRLICFCLICPGKRTRGLTASLLWEKMSRSLILRGKKKRKEKKRKSPFSFIAVSRSDVRGPLCVCGFLTVLMPSGKWVTGREKFIGKKHLFLLNSSYWALRSMEVKTGPISAQQTVPAQCT